MRGGRRGCIQGRTGALSPEQALVLPKVDGSGSGGSGVEVRARCLVSRSLQPPREGRHELRAQTREVGREEAGGHAGTPGVVRLAFPRSQPKSVSSRMSPRRPPLCSGTLQPLRPCFIPLFPHLHISLCPIPHLQTGLVLSQSLPAGSTDKLYSKDNVSYVSPIRMR